MAQVSLTHHAFAGGGIPPLFQVAGRRCSGVLASMWGQQEPMQGVGEAGCVDRSFRVLPDRTDKCSFLSSVKPRVESECTRPHTGTPREPLQGAGCCTHHPSPRPAPARPQQEVRKRKAAGVGWGDTTRGSD